ncbi:MAG: hypothetical protein SFU86_04575 [Pirellulaceae bacterium]|nr:hypothetical protein [Pirellulaceae bacterium]
MSDQRPAVPVSGAAGKPTWPPAVDRLVRFLEREAITRSEFFYSMLEALEKFPAEEKQAILGALADHGSERVRESVVPVQAFVRNQALSRNFEHVRQNSPLHPGMCLELLADDYFYAADNRPSWLSGRECRRARFVRFERQGEHLTPAALVEFDEAIDLPGHKGRFGVLFARYGCDNGAWALPEGSVALCVVEAPPSDLNGFCDSHPFTERHARYRVMTTPEVPNGPHG